MGAQEGRLSFLGATVKTGSTLLGVVNRGGVKGDSTNDGRAAREKRLGSEEYVYLVVDRKKVKKRGSLRGLD